MQEALFHIIGRSDWAAAVDEGRYVPARFEDEGFVHLSRRSQILRPANLLYRGRDDLLLLVIEHSKLTAEVVFEPGSHGESELYPHLYGELNIDAVIDTVDFPCGSDGAFVLPDGLPGAEDR